MVKKVQKAGSISTQSQGSPSIPSSSKVGLSIVIPCYNEEEGIPHLVSQLNVALQKLEQQYAVELVFVDDGSKDKTHELLQKYYGSDARAKIVQHEQNRNLGAALRTGFSHCCGDYVAALDSDCTYNPEVLLTMLGMMDDQTHMVTVSPYHPQGKVNNVPGYRIFLSKGVSLLYKTVLSCPLHTYTAMVRVYKKEVINQVQFKADNFLGVTELLVKSLLQGYKAKELPVELSVRKFGVSKMKALPVKVIGSHLSLLSKIVKYKWFNIPFQ